MCNLVQKRLLFNLFFVLLQVVRGEIRTNDALLNDTHLTEGVWKTLFWDSSFIEQRRPG